MRYFRLRDDVNVDGRWHLGDVTSDGLKCLGITPGSLLTHGSLEVEVFQEGRNLAFSQTSFGVCVASPRLALAIALVAGTDLQRLPVAIPGHGDFEILQPTRAIDCLEESQSEFVKWKAGDHRADLEGHYRMVTRVVVAPDRIPSDGQFFRMARWHVALIVSDAVRQAMLSAGCEGAIFDPVDVQRH